ncbi:cation channel sperm-associated protein subunit epsilon [Camelus ferus]|uniref:Cation channel sperm-associated protein subunit epsilon n=2 Tax=Camelus TaxID=9836 RepID=A0A8B8RWW7_CAMFR|nr:cation channel sperm-associated protein subunit epsilon [Camelus ferus]
MRAHPRLAGRCGPRPAVRAREHLQATASAGAREDRRARLDRWAARKRRHVSPRSGSASVLAELLRLGPLEIQLEYEGTSFSEWSVPGTCSVKNKRSPKTELRCSAGIQVIKPIVTGPDLEEERYFPMENSYFCFLWYHKAINLPDNLTQVIVWVYDPESADPSELLWTADEPSLDSEALSKHLAAMGQKPTIHTTQRRKLYFPHEQMKNGAWHFSVPVAEDDVVTEIKGNEVAFFDCFVADTLFLLTFPFLAIPETPGFLPISSPRGSQLMASRANCVPSSVVVVADMETFQTNDSFRTWVKIRVPPNILTDDERHSVSDVNLTKDGIFLLINGILYIKNFTAFTRLGSNVNLPDSGIIGITSRKWCWLNYLLKDEGIRSSMAIWTENEVYLGYTFPKFVKIGTTEMLKKLVNMSSAATLTIHNVEYTGHPLELGLLLSYCITCEVTKTIYLVIYNEDTKQWVYQDFALDVTIDTFLHLYFTHSALPEFILWDKQRIYYYYHNLKDKGVLQTSTESGNLSRLSQDSNIHDVFIDYFGNIVIKMENNVMFYSKVSAEDAVKLHLWTSNRIKSLISLDSSGQVYLIYVFENGEIQRQEYPLILEAHSAIFKTEEKCPYWEFHNNIFVAFYLLDKGQNLSFWALIVYPENTGLYIIVESYGPKILDKKQQVHYETALGYSIKNMTVTFSQNINYEAVDDYFTLQHQNTGLLLIQVRFSEFAKICPITQKVFQIAVGCDAKKFIAVKGFHKKECRHHDFYYRIEKTYLRDRPSKHLRVKYDWEKYGCPLRLNFKEKFHPLLQLYNDENYVEDVEVNFIVWEIHGRDDYSFNNTMKKSGCLKEAQTWKSMTQLNKHLPLEEAWGPENYKHCFSYAIGKPGDLNQPYEIINKSNNNHLVWPVDHYGMYVFRVKILDPNYSFCNLTAIFAIETFGVIPSPRTYLVAAILFLLMLLFLSLLALSYLYYYLRIYSAFIDVPLHNPETKQKND